MNCIIKSFNPLSLFVGVGDCDTSLAHQGGVGEVKLTGYLDSPHMLFQYLLIHSEGIKATIKEIEGKNSKLKILIT